MWRLLLKNNLKKKKRKSELHSAPGQLALKAPAASSYSPGASTIISGEVLIQKLFERAWQGKKKEKKSRFTPAGFVRSVRAYRGPIAATGAERCIHKGIIPGLHRTAGLLIACHNLWEISQKCCSLPARGDAAQCFTYEEKKKKKKKNAELSPHFNLRFHSQDGSQAFEGVRGVWLGGVCYEDGGVETEIFYLATGEAWNSHIPLYRTCNPLFVALPWQKNKLGKKKLEKFCFYVLLSTPPPHPCSPVLPCWRSPRSSRLTMRD